jgi:hypothetical protein
MDIKAVVNSIDTNTARAFVTAARHVIDALLIEAERVRKTQTPEPRDYNSASLSREAAPGGWISPEELRDTARRLAEAISAEKWVDGVVFAVQIIAACGGTL